MDGYTIYTNGSHCPKCGGSWNQIIYILATGGNEFAPLTTSETCPLLNSGDAHLHTKCGTCGWICAFLTMDST